MLSDGITGNIVAKRANSLIMGRLELDGYSKPRSRWEKQLNVGSLKLGNV